MFNFLTSAMSRAAATDLNPSATLIPPNAFETEPMVTVSRSAAMTAVNTFIGTNRSDFLRGTAIDDRIFGLDGADTIAATIGSDLISGGDGFDTIDYRALNFAITLTPTGVVDKGQAGQDTLFQVEYVIGAVGQANTIDALSTPGGSSINVQLQNNFLQIRDVPNLGVLNFWIENFPNVNGTQNQDSLDGNDVANVLYGFGGNDGIFGRGGNDILIGGAGSDFVAGGDGNDVINGTDIIARGQGEIDDLEGGTGNDFFVFGDRSGSYYKFNGGNDGVVVRDFSIGDVIQLGLGETYQIVSRAGGFDVFVAARGEYDLVASVNTTVPITIPTGNFSLSSGQQLGIFVGA